MKQLLLTSYYKLLGALARRYIHKTKPYIIGINGSVGKTSCRMIIRQTLQQLLPQASVYTSPKNFNGELGMSLSIFEIEQYTPSVVGMIQVMGKALWVTYFSQVPLQSTTTTPKILVLEYGIDHPGEMRFLISIASPHISVHTQIDAVHSLQFGSPEEIAKEEFLLQEHTREIAFVNVDDTYLQGVLPYITCDRITYSATHENTDTIISRNTHSETIPSQQTSSLRQSATVVCNKKKTAQISLPIL
jgi:UDP-N-acetylmuramoyl-tripeptide--D-alanyl-D-alanine ligase